MVHSKILFVSSIYMFIGNFPFIFLYYTSYYSALPSNYSDLPIYYSILPSYYLLGLSTSILNHGFNSRILQILDRTVMAIGSIVDMYYINDIEEMELLMLSIVNYFMAKITHQVFFHVVSHFTITILHNRILMHNF